MSKHIRRALRIIPAVQLVSAALMLIISFFIRDIPVKVSHFYKNGRIVTDSWHETFSTIVAELTYSTFSSGDSKRTEKIRFVAE